MKPVFVVDGVPPEIKWETIQKRLGTSDVPARGGRYSRTTHRGVTGHVPHKMTRSRFKRLAKEVRKENHG